MTDLLHARQLPSRAEVFHAPVLLATRAAEVIWAAEEHNKAPGTEREIITD
jgi:hypothetical protein